MWKVCFMAKNAPFSTDPLALTRSALAASLAPTLVWVTDECCLRVEAFTIANNKFRTVRPGRPAA
jgi:hypothetical protein